jgi:demethylspheroidene O-methyltransferase
VAPRTLDRVGEAGLERPGPPGPRTLVDRYFELRNRVLSSPRFQRWAATFPLTRAIARGRAADVFDLTAGFVYSQVLFAVVELEVLDAVAQPTELELLAARLSLPVPSAERLLDAAAALKLVDRRSGGRYGLGARGAALLGNRGALAMVKHHAMLYRDLADPVALLRGEAPATELNRFWAYARRGSSEPTKDDVEAYSRLMAESLALLAEDILEAFPLDRHRSLLDIGGGEGAFVAAAVARFPGLTASVFDLPPVAARASARLQASSFADRCRVVGGDVFRDALPRGADVISLVRVLHDHDDQAVVAILAAARRALDAGGKLLIAEPMARTPGAEPMGDAYFGFYLLAMGQGRPRSEERLRSMLLEAGFRSVRRAETRRPLLVQVLVAEAGGAVGRWV